MLVQRDRSHTVTQRHCDSREALLCTAPALKATPDPGLTGEEATSSSISKEKPRYLKVTPERARLHLLSALYVFPMSLAKLEKNSRVWRKRGLGDVSCWNFLRHPKLLLMSWLQRMSCQVSSEGPSLRPLGLRKRRNHGQNICDLKRRARHFPEESRAGGETGCGRGHFLRKFSAQTWSLR